MLKKHLTILFLLAATVGGFAQSIPSGTGRFEALGFNPFIMDAATDINRNPAWAGMYRNYAFGDIGRFTPDNQEKGGEYFLIEQYIGTNFGLGKSMTLGAVLNKNEGQVFGGDFRNYYQGLGISAPLVPFELDWTWTNASKKLYVGVAPYYAHWSHDVTTSGPGLDSTVNRSSSILGGTVGVVGKMKDGWWEANADVRLNKYKLEATYTPDSGAASSVTAETDGGLELNVNLRGFFLVSRPNKINVVPYAGFGMFNWKPKVTTVPATTRLQDEYKWMNIKAGVGINMPILDDGLLAGGLSFSMTKSEHNNVGDTTQSANYQTTTLKLPQFNVGGEWKFNDWLTGRMGYARAVLKVKQENTSTAGSTTTTSEDELTIESNPQHTINAGLGWHFGRFSLDGLIGERFFQEGPWLVGGKANDLYGVLSASYNFNK